MKIWGSWLPHLRYSLAYSVSREPIQISAGIWLFIESCPFIWIKEQSVLWGFFLTGEMLVLLASEAA